MANTTLKLASYNVENLFDLKKSGHEYREFIPYSTSKWNKKIYQIKLHNIAKVIKDIDTNIIALQEIESLTALKDLRKELKKIGLYYPYFKIANNKDTTVKVAILSKIPFVYAKEVKVTSTYKYRNILEVKFKVKNQLFYIFVNHWKSKRGPESRRIVSAKALRKRIKEIGFDKNIILLGDFNSDYKEYQKFRRSRRLNDTNSKTGINHILKTIKQTKKAQFVKYKKYNFYNLWYDVDKKQRYSYIFRGRNGAIDNMLISQSLLKQKGIYYKHSSFHHFMPPYLLKGRYIYGWKMYSRKKHKMHKGKGYSDHLPIVASFVIKF